MRPAVVFAVGKLGLHTGEIASIDDLHDVLAQIVRQ